MKFTDIFVQRPVLAIVVSLLIVIAGIQAVSSLSVRQYPRNDNAVVIVNTAYIGASAALVRGFITTPMEQAVGGVDGVEYVESSSAQGLSTVRARLELNYDSIRALSEINAKVSQVRGDLPPESEVPVITVESADSEFASAYLSFSSDILRPNQVTDFLTRVVQPRLSGLEGVQRADVLGGRTFAMRIWLDTDRLAAHGISPMQVRQALSANNYLSALGSTKGSLTQVNLSANTDLQTVEEFQDLVVSGSGDSVIRLSDVAIVELGSDGSDVVVRYNGNDAIFMGIFPLPNSNTLDVMALVRAELDDIRRTLPTGMQAGIAYDASEYIQSSIQEVGKTLAETLIIVMLVIYLFLGSVRSVLVPIAAIPISLIGAVFVMQLFGFSINLLTLLAVVLSVGIVVDDAIVVVENVERHISEGMSRVNAAIKGARELLGPVIAMTATLVAVYLPIGLQGGLTGSLFREFAFTLAGAVFISGVVAVTLSPMMSASLLKDGEKKGFALRVERVFENIRQRYSRRLAGTLKFRPAVYTVWIVISLLCIPMFIMSAKELAPTEDQGVIFGIVDGPGNATIERAATYASHADDVFRNIDESAFTFQLTFPDSGFSGMVLDDWKERDRTVFEIMPEATAKLNGISGLSIFPVTPPALPGGGQFPVEFVIASTDEPEEILGFAEQIQLKAIQSGLFAFPPQIDTKIDKAQSELVIDRDKVASMGLTMQQVGADVGVLLGGAFVNRFNIDGRSYKVIPQAIRTERLNPEQLKELYVTGPDGEVVQLGSIASVVDSTVPRSLNRFQQLNAVKLSGVTIATLDEALSFLEGAAEEILPVGRYSINYTGESRQLRLEGNKFLPAFALAIVLIYLTLSAQFNSFRDPLVILAGSVPLAMFGALIFTFLKIPNPDMPYWTNSFTTTLNIYSQVGLVTLIGLVAKNGILVVEFARGLQEKGLTKLAAIQHSAETRFRPVLMTTTATVAGHFPLVLVSGPGAEARNSIGLVLVGGMTIGTLFTLFVIPSVYMLLARDLKGTRTSLEELEEDDEFGVPTRRSRSGMSDTQDNSEITRRIQRGTLSKPVGQ